MKKLLLALLIVLTLSGCERTTEFTENYQGATDGYTLDNLEYEYLQALMNCDANDTNEPECEVVGYYTQEEVDELLREIYDAFENIESNDGYIESTYVNHNELDLYIKELRDEFSTKPNPNLCDYVSIFRVEVIEEIQNNIYIVGKSGYTVQAYYQIYTEKELQIGSITQVAVYDDDSAKLYNELICVESSDTE